MPTYIRTVSLVEAEDRDPFTAVAHTAHWRVTTDDEHGLTIYGTERLGDPDPNNFVPLADVTAEVVQGWLGEEFWTEKEGKLADQLTEKLASTKTVKTF